MDHDLHLAAFLGENPLGDQALDRRMCGRQDPAALDTSLGRALPDDRPVGAIPQQEAQTGDDQGLAGPRFAGQHRTAGLEHQLGSLDDSQALDHQLGQHPGILVGTGTQPGS